MTLHLTDDREKAANEVGEGKGSPASGHIPAVGISFTNPTLTPVLPLN